MNDNYILAKWQGWIISSNLPLNVIQSCIPNYSKDAIAVMSLLDTLVEKSYHVRLEHVGLKWECTICEPILHRNETIYRLAAFMVHQNKNQAIIDAVLCVIRKEGV